MNFAEQLLQIRECKDYNGLVKLIPYAGYLGMEWVETEGELIFKLPASDHLLGNPTLPAIHGGAIGGFLETSATLHLMLNGEHQHAPKVIDFSIDYLRPGRHEATFAECTVVRQGRKIVNASVSAWQSDRKRPIATARAHFLLAL